MLSKWLNIETLSKNNYKIFDVLWQKKFHPVWKKESNFVVIDSPHWVNIIPLTKNGNFILIEQYRHGTEEITLEIPGGLVEKDEEPKLAGMRECLEETGYSAEEEAIFLGETDPNPAFMNNKCFSYLWKNVERKNLQNLDGNEEINVIEINKKDLINLIKENKIKHSLVLNAFFYYFAKFENLI